MISLDRIYQYLRSTDGVNQFQRSLPALDPSYIGIDERKKSDFINFIRKLAKEVNYYNFNNAKSGDWSPFFDSLDTGSSILVRAASTAALPAVQYDNGKNGVDATLTALINGPLPVQDGITLLDDDLILIWQQPLPIQNGVYSVKQGTKSTPFVLTRPDIADQKNELDQQIVEVTEGEQNARKIFVQKTRNPNIGSSELTYFNNGSSRDDLSPHLALLLAFLQINSVAQQDLNALTGRHLRHYYEQVLQLKRRPVEPDQVHVVFELAKNATPVLLTAGTLLDAGKSSDGKTPLQYGLDSETVITQAIVEQLKSSFADRDSAGKLIVFKADDAKTLTPDAGTTGWRPFGNAQLGVSPETRTMTEAILGFAIASPALLLAEGERTVTITLDVLNTGEPIVDTIQFSHVFDTSLTGDKGWITPLIFTAELEQTKMTFICNIPSSERPISAYDESKHLAGYHTSSPVCRFMVKPDTFQLEVLTALVINNVTIEVAAIGVKNLVLQNDDSVQPAGKPATPFGSSPSIRNNFYIGSNEVFSKSIQSLKFYLEWQDAPANMADYYAGYDNSFITNDKFIADLRILGGKSWNTVLLQNATLFTSLSSENVRTLDLSPVDFDTILPASGYKRKPDLPKLDSFNTDTEQGFVKLVLTGPSQADVSFLPAYAPFEAFGHKAFPLVFTKKAIDLSKSVPDVVLPNAPYTPVLKSVSLDYSARESFVPSNPNDIDQFLMLDLFGYAETKKNEVARPVPLFPVEGALYVGVKNATPPQTVSFLFQVERGTAQGEELLEKSDMHWSYLSGNQWQSLSSGDVVEDATDALQQPGLIRLNLGSDATSTGYVMPAGMHWFRLAVDQRADGAGSLKDLQAQAARATFISNDSTTQVQSLQPGTISKLVNKLSSIKKVKQDYPSFNGLAPEEDTDFFRRISERLRHRNRAVAGWDYERLVLEAYPDVFKVKCLPHTDIDNNISPGHVKLIVVPDMRVPRGGDPLQPKDNPASLRQIENYLSEKYLDGFITPHVSNPEYETLLVDCKVTFLPGFDPGFYANQLEEDIRRFLSPWAYEEGQDIIFGGKIYKSEILAFVEGRPYVDFVINFQVYHRFTGEGLPGGIGCMTIGDDFIVGVQPASTISSADGTVAGATIGLDFVIGDPVEVAEATRPDAIIVSNDEHRIEVLQAGSFVCSGVSNLGIGQMVIGLDFIPIS